MTVGDVAAPRSPARGGLLSPATRRTLRLLWLILSRELRLTRLLFASELRELMVSRALWAMVLISAPLVGFSFIQAVRRYSETSSNALKLPQLAANLSPLDGIIGPTLGAVYLMNTFLLPFVAIRLIGNGKQTGALKLVLQLPIGPNRLVAIKLAALGVGWLIALLPTLSALAVWGLLLGGHLYLPEVATALLGHMLYAFVIAGVAFLAASLTESSATAAIVALSFTLGSWVLEFAGTTTNTGLVRAIASFSLTPALRGLEHGLLGSPTALTLLVLGFAFMALTVVWLPPGVSRRQKLLQAGAVVGVSAQMLLLVIQLPLFVDVSEDRRNSFNPADERALRQMTKELKVSVNLASNDSRLTDLERNVLSKLPRAMPRVSITYPETSSTSLFGGTTGANYGQVTYTYGGKQGTSRATTARELLPLIEALGGLNVTADKTAVYPGFPLVTSAESAAVWFYLLLPAIAGFGWWYNQRAPLVPESIGGTRRQARWPWLEAYLPRIRPAVWWGAGALLVLQLVPYGRSHVNVTVGAPPAAAAGTCQTVFPLGSESSMRLREFKAAVSTSMVGLNGVLVALAGGDPGEARAQYAQFAGTYRGMAKELAELYPGRCPRLNADAIGADGALPSSGAAAATPWLYALNVGLLSVSMDLDSRVRQAGPDQPVGLETPETDQPSITGTPPWNAERTQVLATRACGACHSNQPNLPWYTNVAPMSWLAQYEVDAGHSALNFSEFDRPQASGAAQAAASVQRGTMPPAWAASVEPRLRLTDAERAELVQGLMATLNGVR